ncbi:MAG: hypothetical protein JW932_13125, partial [Deltaproteobacteria bacterium]|nr:hypothetical protein [Deltaproteobacteria bacterium]
RCLLFVPVLNSIRRSDGGGEKAMSAFGCELEKRSLYPQKPFLDKHVKAYRMKTRLHTIGYVTLGQDRIFLIPFNQTFHST